MKETEELPVDSSLNDLDLITKKHYEKQMAVIKTILNLDKKGLFVREIGMKVQLSDSYVEMVVEKGEKEMDKYWKKMYNIKEEK